MISKKDFVCLTYRLLSILIGGIISLTAYSAPPPFRTLDKITDSLYRYQYDHYVTMVLDTPEGLLIADPSSTEGMIALKTEIDARFKKPVKYMIYSHHHADHIGGGAVFANEGTTIVAHEKARKMLAEQTIEIAKLPVPDTTFDESMVLKFGGRTIELFAVQPETHAEGLIAMRFVEDRTLFVVDIVVIEGMPWMNMELQQFPAYIDTIKSLEALDFDHLASGHYRLATKAEMVEHRAFLEDLRDATQDAIDKGLSIKEAKASIKLDKYKHFKLYDEWLPLSVEGAYRHLKIPGHSEQAHIERVRQATAHEDPNNTDQMVISCAFCHGPDGTHVAHNAPSLAGQKYEYLVKSMQDFRFKRRYEHIMSVVLPFITEDEIQHLAKHYSQLNSPEMAGKVQATTEAVLGFLRKAAPKPSPTNLKLLTDDPNLEARKPRSEVENANLVAAGKNKAQLCVACHGADGVGTGPLYPNLAGQNELYLTIQLKLMKYGGRDAPLMKPFVEMLSDADIDAVSAYFSSLPRP